MNRQTKLQDLGVKFIRFSDVDVKKNMNGVLSALKKTEEVVEHPPGPLQRGGYKHKNPSQNGEGLFWLGSLHKI